VLRWILEAWTAYAHRAASYQTGVLLTLVYAVVLGPAAMIARLFGARLMDTTSGDASTWLTRGAAEKSLEALRRQF
jgi:hypothetical protein